MSEDWLPIESVPTRKEARGPLEEAVEMEIDTREGTVVAREGDFIIREKDGNEYPISAEKFKRFYRRIGENDE